MSIEDKLDLYSLIIMNTKTDLILLNFLSSLYLYPWIVFSLSIDIFLFFSQGKRNKELKQEHSKNFIYLNLRYFNVHCADRKFILQRSIVTQKSVFLNKTYYFKWRSYSLCWSVGQATKAIDLYICFISNKRFRDIFGFFIFFSLRFFLITKHLTYNSLN